MTQYVLDTNHLSHAIGKVSVLRERIRQCSRSGDHFATCIPALCELEVGIRQTKDVEGNHRRLKSLLKMVAVWPLEINLPASYADYFAMMKSRGRVLSRIDLILAALATIHEAVLLTADKDFTAFPEVPTENWLVP